MLPKLNMGLISINIIFYITSLNSFYRGGSLVVNLLCYNGVIWGMCVWSRSRMFFISISKSLPPSWWSEGWTI